MHDYALVTDTGVPEGVLVGIEEPSLTERDRVLEALQEHGAVIREEYDLLHGGVLIHAMVPSQDACFALNRSLSGTAWATLTDPPPIADDSFDWWEIMSWPQRGPFRCWTNPSSIRGGRA